MADIEPVNMKIDMSGFPAGDEHLVDAGAPAAEIVVIPSEAEADDPLPASAALQSDGSVILTLNYPVVLQWKRQGSDSVREDSYATLHMHRLTGGDMRAVMAAGTGHTVTTGIAKSCRIQQGLFNRVYDKMDGADAAAAARVFSFFLEVGAPKATGQPSSP